MTESEFWSRVDIRSADECWEWQGIIVASGYGHAPWDGRQRRAHRVAWELTNGPIPYEMLVCHSCDNPPCCNPRHLFIGTHKDNKQDSIRKGRCLNEESRRKIGDEHRGLHHTEDAKQRISKALTGRQFTEEHRRKIGEANHRRGQSLETRRKISDAHKGKPMSEETRRKIYAANKGKQRSIDVRRKIGEALKGHAVSEETRRKISESRIKLFQLRKESVL